MAYLDDVYAVVQIQPTGVETFVRLSQNENGRKLYFAIQGGELPSGSTATISGTKPDGVVYSASAAVSSNVVTVNEDIQMTAAAGAWPAKLRILNGGQVIATGRIRFVVDADPVAPGSVPSDSELEGLVAEAAAYAEAAKNAAYYGSPLVAATVAGMTDHTRVYVYTGSESGYTNGNWYYWNGSAWTSGGVYNAQGISTDTSLTISGKAADSKATGDRLTAAENDISDVKSDLSDLEDVVESLDGGLSDEAKEALLNCFYHVVWADSSGEEYCRLLEQALYPSLYPRIMADLALGTHVVYEGDSLSSLTPYLTVRLYQSESDTGTIIPSTDYTLSGTLVVGTSSVTITYNDLSTSVNVPVATHVRYQLSETKTFDGTAASDFNTGFNLFETDMDFTVVCTGTINAGTSGQTILFARDNDGGFAFTLEYSYNSSTGYSMYTNSHNNNSHSRGTGSLSGSYPFKFAFSHARGASTYTVQIKFNNKNVTERNATYTYVKGDFPLVLGCKYWVSGGAISQYGTPRFNGSITELKVLDYAMTQAECNQYCA